MPTGSETHAGVDGALDATVRGVEAVRGAMEQNLVCNAIRWALGCE